MPTPFEDGAVSAGQVTDDTIIESTVIPTERRFGASAAVDGDTLVVGAPEAPSGGAAYVFTRTEDGWAKTDTLVAPGGAGFGSAVALAEDTLFVGAQHTEVDGNEHQGAVYVFTRTADTWTRTTTLVASDGAEVDQFGKSLALDGDTLAVGAPHGEDVSTGVGAVYVFSRVDDTWSETATLVPDDEALASLFGWSLALDGETLAVGTARGGEAGAAYVFTRSGATWAERVRLTASDAGPFDWFGWSVALAGETLIVGGLQPGGFPPPPGEPEPDTVGGALYVFTDAGGTWTETAKVTASDGASDHSLGVSVALTGDLLVGRSAEAAYVFTMDEGEWIQVERLAVPAGGSFGGDETQVFMTGDTLVVGSSEAAHVFTEAGETWNETAILSVPFQQHFAEGATGFFRTDVGLVNTSDTDVAEVLVTLNPETRDGAVTVPLTLEPHGRQTIDVNAAVGDEGGGVSIHVESDQPVAATREMRWGPTSTYGSTLESGMPDSAATWYFAEGATSLTNLFYLIANPNNAEANVTIRYLRGDGDPVTQEVVLPAQSRRTIWANSVEGLESVEVAAVISADRPIVAERSMYLGPQFNAGATSRGASTLSHEWFFAEGETSFFDTFLSLGNPGDTAAEVDITYEFADTESLTKTYALPPESRRTILVDQEDAQLARTAVAMSVSSSEPIVVERAMWWGPTAASWYGAHSTLGATDMGHLWAVGEASSGGPNEEETYVLVAIWPPRESGRLRLTAVLDDGTTAEQILNIPGRQNRVSLRLRDHFPELEGQRFSLLVESISEDEGLGPVTVEYARYHSTGGRFANAGGAALATRIQ